MKNINEMTDQEILDLSDQQIEKIIRYKMAEEGVKLFKKPLEPEYEEEIKKDLTYWKVDGIEYLFVDKEDAELISNNLQKLKDKLIKMSWNTAPKLLSQERDYRGNQKEHFLIVSENFFSQEVYETAQSIEKRNRSMKDNYEKLLEEYNNSYEASQYIRDEIWNKIIEIRDKYNNFKRLKNLFSQYLELAEQNEEIAWNFLKKVETVSEEAENFIKNN